MTAATVLATHGLTKDFGDTRAVNDVSLTVRDGDVYGFLGLNGAGKTTTMRMALGLLTPTAGSIELFGRDDPAGRLAARADLGAMVEGPAFYAHLSGAKNLDLLGSLSGKIEKKLIHETLERVGLADAANKKAGEYSLGMKQRLGIALATFTRPRFCILDEPTNGLDPNGIIEMRRFIAELNERDGTTFMISSHLLHEIELSCNRVGILEKGRLVLESSMEDVAREMGGSYRLAAEPLEKAVAILDAQKGIEKRGQPCNGSVEFRLPKQSLPALHRALHDAGVRVFTLAEQRINLEEFFLANAQVGEGALT